MTPKRQSLLALRPNALHLQSLGLPITHIAQRLSLSYGQAYYLLRLDPSVPRRRPPSSLALDEAILKARSSTLNISRIARMVGLTRQATQQRLARLRRDGILKVN